jgi:cytosine deaminase
MAFDLLLKNARLADGTATDIGVNNGRISALAADLGTDARELYDCGGRLVSPGFVETHIHLDKTCTIDRCECETARFPHRAMERTSAIKSTFTVEDVTSRAQRTLEKCIMHGATVMRTHAEVDPKVGLRGLDGVKALVEAYKWAIDIEICVMPQEGLTNNPGTDELMVAALENGATVVGAAPSYDSDPAAQIHRVFELARRYGYDIDMHADSGSSAAHLDVLLICDLAEKYGYEGRVAIGHGTKLSVMPADDLAVVAKRMANAGVALTVLPATDMYLGGREKDHRVERSVADGNRLLRMGVNCNLSSNNILNAFTPLGDGQLIRMANMYANVVQHAMPDDLAETWTMLTTNSAKLLRRKDYGIAVGNDADLVVVDAPNPVAAIREIAPTLCAYKRGRRTFTRAAPVLHRPE